MRASRAGALAPGRLWLAADALELMVCEAQRSEPLETGGVLLGWADPEGGDLFAVRMLGPGPRAVHKPTRFSPDTAWQRSQIAEAYEASGRIFAYLGDWHSHPRGDKTPSRRDERTGRRISRSRSARAPRPLVLILSGSSADWKPAPYRYFDGKLRPMPWRLAEAVDTRIALKED
jgi:integrative and conjugative element protein (TIGR02256 family)